MKACEKRYSRTLIQKCYEINLRGIYGNETNSQRQLKPDNLFAKGNGLSLKFLEYVSKH